mmetsp:Transcript_45734/g.143405  ORF Transcript_45734/g.143405 Transcript_45734/m.143405 type:complete len:254 (+) Transcript_45734:628-1389(+)
MQVPLQKTNPAQPTATSTARTMASLPRRLVFWVREPRPPRRSSEVSLLLPPSVACESACRRLESSFRSCKSSCRSSVSSLAKRSLSLCHCASRTVLCCCRRRTSSASCARSCRSLSFSTRSCAASSMGGSGGGSACGAGLAGRAGTAEATKAACGARPAGRAGAAEAAKTACTAASATAWVARVVCAACRRFASSSRASTLTAADLPSSAGSSNASKDGNPHRGPQPLRCGLIAVKPCVCYRVRWDSTDACHP